RIPESEGIHRTGTRPLRTCPTHRCQSNVFSSSMLAIATAPITSAFFFALVS
ncbi:hypothetical protein GPK41_01575, partial [Bifidobacterium adolescentis]|nr:hypothetical protein [Bifidobacterium adolescentis]